MSLWHKIRDELSSFQRSEKLFCVFAMLVCCLIQIEYSTTRPASNALCITMFSAEIFPWLWLATVPINLFVVAFYNRFLPSIGPVKMMASLAGVTMLINSATAYVIPFFPEFILLQFVWKDIYILFMFKQLWSLIHSTITASRAKYLYGIIYFMGTLGSIIGGLLPSFCAVQLGSSQLFLLTLPVYVLLFLCYRQAFQYSAVEGKDFLQNIPKEKAQGFGTVFRSPLLLFILILLVLMQSSVAIAEYQFNAHLRENIAELDLRTEYTGRAMLLTNILSGLLQCVGSFVLIRMLGVKGSHFVIPMLLLSNAFGVALFPSFALVTSSMILIKALDFSLFGVIREMLYIPLKLDEKFRAKAVIDVFAYRTSKALIAFCIIGLQYFLQMNSLLLWLNHMTITILLLWLVVLWVFIRKYHPISA